MIRVRDKHHELRSPSCPREKTSGKNYLLTTLLAEGIAFSSTTRSSNIVSVSHYWRKITRLETNPQHPEAEKLIVKSSSR